MTEAIAQRMQHESGYTEEERRIARLWLKARHGRQGDGRHLERPDEPTPFTVTLGEAARIRRGA